MTTRNYYVLCDDNCRFEGMTKEQIYDAIAEATGATPTLVDQAFITQMKEQNAQASIKIWKGTSAQYNALATKQANTLYFVNGNYIKDSEELETDIYDLTQSVAGLQTKLNKIKVYNPGDIITENVTGNMIAYGYLTANKTSAYFHIPFPNILFSNEVADATVSKLKCKINGLGISQSGTTIDDIEGLYLFGTSSSYRDISSDSGFSATLNPKVGTLKVSLTNQSQQGRAFNNQPIVMNIDAITMTLITAD